MIAYMGRQGEVIGSESCFNVRKESRDGFGEW